MPFNGQNGTVRIIRCKEAGVDKSGVGVGSLWVKRWSILVYGLDL